MVVFNEPEAAYKLEKIKKKNINTRIRILILWILFSLVIVSVEKNNFELDFLKTEAASFKSVCDNSSRTSNTDEPEIGMEKARNVLDLNLENLKKIDGYLKSYVSEETKNNKIEPRPVINIVLASASKTNMETEQDLCGFPVRILYK